MTRHHASLSPLPVAPQTDDEIELSKRYTPLLRQIAARADLQVRVARTTRAVAAVEKRNGEPVLAPGAYWAGENLIELETSLLGDVDIRSIDPRHFSDLTRIAVMHGVAVHQAAHAAHTVLDFDAFSAELPALQTAALLLEEVRAEHRLLMRRRPDALWLRAAARSLLRFELINDGELLWDAAKVALLTCGRTDAGSLHVSDVESAKAACVAALSEEKFARLEGIWRQVLLLDDGDQESLLLFAEHWCNVVGIDKTVDPEAVEASAETIDTDLDMPEDGESAETSEEGEPSSDAKPSGGAGSPSGGSGSPDPADAPDEPSDSDSSSEDDAADSSDSDDANGEPSDEEGSSDEQVREDLRDALRDLANETTEDAAEELAEQGEVREKADEAQKEVEQARKQEARQRQADAQERREEAAAAEDVFSDEDPDEDADPDHGKGAAGHNEAVRGWRAPTGAEIAASMQLARALEQRLWRPPDQHRLTSELPPGRLHSRGAMAQSVQIALGKPVTARPWKRTLRTPEPPLKLVVGLGVDRSGSMSGIIKEACSAAWIVAAAARRVDAKFASVTFGEQTRPLTKPGVIPEKVPQLAANAGFETIGSAIKVLDGALNLSDPNTVRLLCIVSDGHWVDDDEDRVARVKLAKLKQSGCGLLLCNAGEVNPDVPHMEKLRLDDPSLMADMLAKAILATLDTL